MATNSSSSRVSPIQIGRLVRWKNETAFTDPDLRFQLVKLKERFGGDQFRVAYPLSPTGGACTEGCEGQMFFLEDMNGVLVSDGLGLGAISGIFLEEVPQ